MRWFVVLALAAGIIEAGRWQGRDRTLAAAVVVAAVIWPVPAAALASAGGAFTAVRYVRRRARRRRAVQADVVVLAELTLMGLDAGLTFSDALAMGATEVGDELAAEVQRTLRSARRAGLGAALEQAPGRAQRLYRLAGRATATGAPLAAAVGAFVAEERHRERTRRQEAARKLPVRLVVPLTLLILPGFVVLTLGPTLLGSVRRLGL